MILIFGPTFDFPWWFVLAVVALWLIVLAIGLAATYVSIRGVYLLLSAQTTAKVKLNAAVLGIFVSIVLLLAALGVGYLKSSEMVTLVLSVPFGLFAGQILFLLISAGNLPSWIVSALLPFFTVLNIFLNYTGYIAIVDFLKKRSLTSLS
ncbi:MAG: hypothetical protein DMF62_05920 [Acidobacteria bacterium]|nr:MAG: hypothetical protein DMF62_05920 [Acidobacteriota bacterium]